MLRPQGFTLSEVMVAVVLISIAALGLISVQIYALRANVVNRQQHTASDLAASVIADREQANLQQDVFQAASSDYPLYVVTRTPYPGYEGQPLNQRFEYAVNETFQDTPPAGQANHLKRISVQVFYYEKDAGQMFQLDDLVTDGG